MMQKTSMLVSLSYKKITFCEIVQTLLLVSIDIILFGIHCLVCFQTEVKADFTVPLNDVTAQEKSTAEFVCELTKDVDKVRWFLDNVELRQGDRIEFVKDDKKHKLLIHNVMVDDEGQITVHVDDKKASASLFVQGETIMTI